MTRTFAIMSLVIAVISAGGCSESSVKNPTELIDHSDADQDGSTRPKSEDEVVALLPGFIEGLVEKEDFAGVVLFARDAEVLFHNAVGLASRRFDAPNKLDTGFNVASMGKMFTAVAIAQLAEEGKLSFDDPIGKYLESDWVSTEVGEKARISHLLSHTSGLGHYWTEEFNNSSKLVFRTLDGFKPFISDELAFQPGTDRAYSNSGYVLLGVIIEKVTGSSYFDHIRDTIFTPSGMTGTAFYERDKPVPNIAVGYYRDEGGVLLNNTFNHPARGGPAGGAISNAPDLHKFALAMQTNKLITAETKEILWTPKPHSKGYGYGFGFGAGWIGHLGGFEGISNTFFIYPDTGHIVITLANSGDSEAITEKIIGMLAGWE